jgi:hypothetical protein
MMSQSLSEHLDLSGLTDDMWPDSSGSAKPAVTPTRQHRDMARPRLRVLPDSPTAAGALAFSDTVRTVVQLCRRGGLVPPVFRSPPGSEAMDRTIRYRGSKPPVVAIRRLGRPLPAVQADVIEAIVVSNRLSCERAERFRRAAWRALEGASAEPSAGHREPEPDRGSEHVA